MTDPKIARVLVIAQQLADLATSKYLAAHPNHWFPCGFAWVRVPGNSPIARFLRDQSDFAGLSTHKGYPKGFDIWNPSGNPTQCLDAKLAGAEAFAEALRLAGFEAEVGSRWD
jgi:hypothetical protein